MAFKPTKEQALAIQHSGGVLVSAAAGSGKTAVLVERIIRQLSDRINPISADKLLVVTFTNAAAAELRVRIDKRLSEETSKHPSDVFLQKQRMLLNGAKICTIDSFCLDFIKENFENTELGPIMHIADNAQLAMLEKSAMNTVMNRNFDSGDKNFYSLLDFLGDSFDDSKLRNCIKTVYDFSRNMPFPKQWLAETANKYSAHSKGEDSFWFDIILEVVADFADEANALISRALELLESNEEAYAKYSANYLYFSECVDAIRDAIGLKDWDRIVQHVSKVSPPKCKALLASEKSKEICESVDLRDETKDVLKKISSILYADKSKVKSDLTYQLPFVEKIVSLVNEFETELYELLKSKELITFYISEQTVLSMIAEYSDGRLVPRSDAKDYIDRFDAILVDEYQDTNSLQDAIFNILSDGGKKLFCVGDVKQSIYKFRGANPQNFLAKKQASTDIEHFAEGDFLRVDLSSNFRSRPEICDFINSVFSKVIYQKTSGFDYDSSEQLNAMAVFPESNASKVEQHFFDLACICENSDIAIDSQTVVEAEFTANKIFELLAEEPFLRSGENLRKAEYSDVTILVRSMRDKGNLFIQTLKSTGIPVSAATSEVLDSDEVKTLIALLALINNPTDDISLLTVLTSPIFGFKLDDLAEIRSRRRNCNMISALSLASEDNDKALRFCQTLEKLRRKSVLYSVSRLVEEVFFETGMINVYSQTAFGEICVDNLYAFAAIATGFENGKSKGLEQFLRYVAELKNRDLSSSASHKNSVKVMTIHKSKGLQFPICIVSGCSNRFNVQDLNKLIAVSEKHGISLSYFDNSGERISNSLPRSVMKFDELRQLLAEELRILYVALTRAEEKLILLSTYNDLNKQIEEQSLKIDTFSVDKRLAYPIFKGTDSCAHWLLNSLIIDGEIDASNFESLSSNVFLHRELTLASKKQDEKVAYEVSAETVSNLKELFSYTYPYKPILDIVSKQSVTDLVHKTDREQFGFSSRPAFMQKDGISASELGTAVHKIMQFADYSVCVFDLDSEIERLKENMQLSETEAEAIPREKLHKFFGSPLCDRILQAETVKKEFKFLTDFSVCSLYEGIGDEFEGEDVVIQGAVDLLFVEKNKLNIVDFKTDRNKIESELLTMYAEQLRLYAKACSKIFDLEIGELILYSFELGCEIKVK